MKYSQIKMVTKKRFFVKTRPDFKMSSNSKFFVNFTIPPVGGGGTWFLIYFVKQNVTSKNVENLVFTKQTGLIKRNKNIYFFPYTRKYTFF